MSSTVGMIVPNSLKPLISPSHHGAQINSPEQSHHAASISPSKLLPQPLLRAKLESSSKHKSKVQSSSSSSRRPKHASPSVGTASIPEQASSSGSRQGKATTTSIRSKKGDHVSGVGRNLGSSFQISAKGKLCDLGQTISTGMDVGEGDEDGGHVGPMLSQQVLSQHLLEEKREAGASGASDGLGGAVLPQFGAGSSLGAVDAPVAFRPQGGEADKGSRMLAAVDMGTNSFHMVIVKADASGRFQIEDVEKEDVRLGSGSAGFSMITPEAEERAMAAIKRLQRIAATRHAEMRVVATSAVREARNRRSFVKRILDTTGVKVEVLSGREEACLIYLGILHALPVFKSTVLTVDIGGGSTEFVIGREGQPIFATSLKLGHIRLTERFVGSEPLQRPQIEEMRRFIRVMLADSGVLEVLRQTEFELAVGSSGTIETLESMIHGGKPQQLAGQRLEADATARFASFKEKEFTLEELSNVVKKICKAKTPEARAKLPGLQEKRADVIVGGAILLEEIFLALGINKMRVSPYALREGVIVDTLSRTFSNFRLNPDLRRSSVMNLALKFNTDKRLDSALHSAHLAKQILAGLQTCKTGGSDCVPEAMRILDVSDFDVLEAATILHYVGMFISHKGYHKHSHYLIKHTEQLLGYSPMEVEMIALLVRYHRKKVPTPKDEDFANLPDILQAKVRALCAILRVAVALDRCDTGAVESVLVLQDNDSCVLVVSPAQDPATGKSKDVALELWAARADLEYFEKVFKRVSSIVVADELDVDAIDVDRSPSLSS